MRAFQRLLTGLAALLGTAALTAGAPLLLGWAGGDPLPDRVPSLDDITGALTAPDDGALFLHALTLVGWVAWATFMLGLLVEIPARLRGRRPVRVRGLRFQQRVAAALIGAILAVFTGGVLASAAPAPRAAVVIGEGLPEPTGVQSVAVPPPAVLPQPVIAQVTAAAPSLAVPAIQRPVYIVKRGDYLGKIAERFTGDFERYHQIAALNRKLIHNPDRIRPGWRLTLPVDAHDRGPLRHAAGRMITPVSKKPASGSGSAVPSAPGSAGPAVPAGSAQQPAARPARQGANVALAVLAGLAAAGVLAGHALLWRRRVVRIHRHQLRRHRAATVRFGLQPVPSEWTAPPAAPIPADLSTTVEQAELYEPRLRHPADTAERLDASLRKLAVGLRSRPAFAMPDIFAAWHYGGELGVVLAAPCADPPEPYSARSADTWALPSGTTPAVDEDAPALLPALLTLGTWPEGGELLVDSERTGLLTLVGDPENCDDLLRHLAAEAATAAWADTAAVLLAGFNAADTRAIGALNEARVRSVPSVPDALARIARRAVVNRSVLRESGIADTMVARVNNSNGSLWTTHILFVADPWGQHTDELAELDAQLADFGRVGVSVVATHPTTTRWSVTVDSAGNLDMPWLAFSDTTACRLTGGQLGALAATTGNPEYAGMPIAGARHRSRA